MIVVFAGGSRGNFLILFICLFLYLLLYKSKRTFQKYLCIVLLTVIPLFTVYIFADTEEFSLVKRLEETVENGDDGGRKALEEKSLLIFYDYPILGSGFFKQKYEMKSRFKEDRPVHNMFIFILSCTGVIGCIFFISFYLYFGLKAFEIKNKSPLSLILFIYTTLLVYKTGGVFLYIIWWYVFAIIKTLVDCNSIPNSSDENNIHFQSKH